MIVGAAAGPFVFVNVYVAVVAAFFVSVAVIVTVWLPMLNPAQYLLRTRENVPFDWLW